MKYLALIAVVLSLGFAQNYRCDWSVVGIGGGEMSSSAYKCGATAGQTAAGFITGPNYWALIGFWQREGQTGVREAAQWSSGPVLKTALYSPFPTPFVRSVAIRYSLCAEARIHLTLHDLTGRVVRTLADGVQKPGRHILRWNGSDAMGRTLAHGVYFVRLNAGDYTGTEKLVLQR